MCCKAYETQVALVVQALPFVAMEKVFALKGGTAINLFFRDLPRLSVDIDLTYLPNKDRGESLVEINDALGRIATAIEGGISGATTRHIKGGGGNATRISVRMDAVEIKIEVSPITRGVVRNTEMRRVSNAVEAKFGLAEIKTIAFR